MAYRIAVSAGEVSGDQHLAEVVQALHCFRNGVEIVGMAGSRTEAAGTRLVVDSFRHGATMGFLELLGSLRSIRFSFTTMKSLLREWMPQLLIIVDYPDFNIRLAEYAKKLNIKVLYYIPPKVWAWRSGRVPKINRCSDAIASIFPFEPDFYRARGVTQVYYVGNPVADAAGKIDLPEAGHTSKDVVILAGSRRSEVQRILVPLLKSFEMLLVDSPQLTASVVVAPNMNIEALKSTIGPELKASTLEQVSWRTEDALTVMARGRIGLLKSGTCNLEAAMVGLPFVCVYSGTQFAKIIVDRFVALTEYSPVNIIRSGTVPEVNQVTLEPKRITLLGKKLLTDSESRSKMEHGLAEVRGALQSGSDPKLKGASVAQRVANLALQLVEGN